MGIRHTTHFGTISLSMLVVMRDLSCSTQINIMVKVKQVTNGSLSMIVLLVILSIQQQIKKTPVIVRSIIEELYRMPIRNNVHE